MVVPIAEGKDTEVGGRAGSSLPFSRAQAAQTALSWWYIPGGLLLGWIHQRTCPKPFCKLADVCFPDPAAVPRGFQE